MLCLSKECTYLRNPDAQNNGGSHCCPSCKENPNSHDDSCVKTEYIDRIPKQIFMCDKTLKFITKYSENWKKLNPEYEIKLYDDQQCKDFLVKEYSKKHLNIFNFLKDGPIKADFWRVCILYKYGGLYVDADAEPLIPLSEYIDPTADFITCSSYGVALNFNPNFIMVKAGDEFLKRCIEEYVRMFNEKIPYSYWGYSIMTVFNTLLKLVDYRKISSIYYDSDGKKHQILLEVEAPKLVDDFNEYNGVKVFNNRYKSYDYLSHSFKE